MYREKSESTYPKFMKVHFFARGQELENETTW